MQQGGFTYIMTNRPDGVLYVGVTSDIHQRMHQHRTELGSRFCQKYGINMLVLVERHATIEEAIAREKQLENWQPRWKIALIEAANPGWRDLSGYLD